MGSSWKEQTTMTIPGAYLEAVQTALVDEIVDVADALRVDHASMLAKPGGSGREDRDATLRELRRQVDLLDELRDADGDTDVAACRETLQGMLEGMCKRLRGRLVEEEELRPIEASGMLDIAQRLHWAAEWLSDLRPDLRPVGVA